MAKTKHKKYQRVQELSNVILPDKDRPMPELPWRRPPYAGMETVLELGCGRGEHSLGFASRYPDTLFIGVDLKSHRLCHGGERGLAQGLENLFFLRARVEESLDYFADHAVSSIWLTFPDPHPKQRGIKHRLSSAGFFQIYSRLLRPGGQIHLKTDSRRFYDYTMDSVHYWGGTVLAAQADLHGQAADAGFCPGDETAVVSAFEGKALKQGRTIKYLAFTLT